MQQPGILAEAAPCPPREPPLKANLPPGVFALVLALAIFAAFPAILLGLESFVVRDFGFFAYPLAYFQRECFWRGELPLWNPYNHCGVPFLAQWNTMPLYPPALIYLVLPLPWSLNFFCLLHLFWAGLGMFALARRWTRSDLGAAVAGMAFGFNGFALNLLMWPSHIATYSWMPWVVLLVEAGYSRGGKALTLAVLGGAMQMLAGGPETILFTWTVLAALWFLRLVGKQPSDTTSPGDCVIETHSRLAVAWRFPGIVLLVACLCAAQLLPFLDLAVHSQREQGFADARWSMPSWGWANFLVPMVFGTAGKQGLFFQYNQYWTSSYYLGIGALLLAFIGMRAVRARRVWLLAGIAIVGLLLATGDQTVVSRWARQLLPQLSFMTYPVKYLTLVIFCVPLLAAYGMSALQSEADTRVLTKTVLGPALVLLVLIVGVLVWAWLLPFATDNVSATTRNGISRILMLVGVSAFLVTVPKFLFREAEKSNKLAHGKWVALVLLVVLWLDVWTHEPQQNPSVPGWVYSPGLARTKLQMNPQPELGGSRAMLSPAAETKYRELVLNDAKDNFLIKRLGYFADCNLLDAVPTVNGFFSLAPRECGELNSILYVSRYGFSGSLPDFLCVSQSSSTNDYTGWDARTTSLPFATAGQLPVFLHDTNALGVMLSTNFNPAKFVLLPVEAMGWVSVTNQTNARVTSAIVKSARVDLQVEAEAPSMVVLSQTYYHPWNVRVDGRPERLLRANFAFQAFQVSAGKHVVSVVYEDRALRIGLACSGVALLACLLGWLVFPRSNPLRKPQQE